MTDYEDFLSTMLLQQGLPSLKVPQGRWSGGSGKWETVLIEQNLPSPLPVTISAQENPKTVWLKSPFTSAVGTNWEENALWRERQRNVAIAAMRDEISSVSQQLAELKREILRLQSLRAYVVPLTTLSSEFQLTQPIPVTIEGEDENFTATFAEANISASGETEGDAIANFKDSLVASYQVLEATPANKLGPLPDRQWKVLQNVVRRTK